jgi:hypothetical protein
MGYYCFGGSLVLWLLWVVIVLEVRGIFGWLLLGLLLDGLLLLAGNLGRFLFFAALFFLFIFLLFFLL